MASNHKLKLISHQESFKLAFRLYKKKLQGILANIKHEIQHFGSTSIPRTIGKGVIDIMIIFDDKKTILKAKKNLEKSGYFNRKKKKRGKRIFLASNPVESQPYDAHLHLVKRGTPEHLKPLKFADSLRKSPRLVNQYNKLKLKLLHETKGNRPEYTERKSGFVSQVLNQKTG